MIDKIVTIEISMYPLQDDYSSVIIDFIKRLKQSEGLTIKTHAMSTYVKGPFSLVWAALGDCFSDSFFSDIPIANIIKLIPRDLPIEEGWLEF